MEDNLENESGIVPDNMLFDSDLGVISYKGTVF